MAQRPVFRPRVDSLGVNESSLEFQWHPGLSVSQKRKSIASLHAASAKAWSVTALEVSSKSTEAIGQEFSAFSLHFARKSDGCLISVESAYQSAKVFEGHGPFEEVASMDPREARRAIGKYRELPLIAFQFEGRRYSLSHGPGLYHHLYRRAVLDGLPETLEMFKEISGRYGAFTDIEFNPKTAVNCQARCLALLVSADRRGELSDRAETAWLSANVLRPASGADPMQGQLFRR